MIKRRFYRAERGDKDEGSSDSSSDSEVEVRSSDESDNELPNPEPEPASNVEADNDDDDDDNEDDDSDDGDENRTISRLQRPSSSSSGYESEDSSANEIDADSGGLLAVDDDSESGKDEDLPKETLFPRKENGEAEDKDHPAMGDLPKCVLQIKSVYKCKLCPKIVCLNEESLRTHLKSKRHSRSEKLLKEGRLKRVLNSDGEEEVMSDDDGETHAERHARIMAIAQDTPAMTTKKSKGRQRQRNRLKRKRQKNSSSIPSSGQNSSSIPSSGQQTENRAKRRRRNLG